MSSVVYPDIGFVGVPVSLAGRISAFSTTSAAAAAARAAAAASQRTVGDPPSG